MSPIVTGHKGKHTPSTLPSMAAPSPLFPSIREPELSQPDMDFIIEDNVPATPINFKSAPSIPSHAFQTPSSVPRPTFHLQYTPTQLPDPCASQTPNSPTPTTPEDKCMPTIPDSQTPSSAEPEFRFIAPTTPSTPSFPPIPFGPIASVPIEDSPVLFEGLAAASTSPPSAVSVQETDPIKEVSDTFRVVNHPKSQGSDIDDPICDVLPVEPPRRFTKETRVSEPVIRTSPRRAEEATSRPRKAPKRLVRESESEDELVSQPRGRERKLPFGAKGRAKKESKKEAPNSEPAKVQSTDDAESDEAAASKPKQRAKKSRTQPRKETKKPTTSRSSRPSTPDDDSDSIDTRTVFSEERCLRPGRRRGAETEDLDSLGVEIDDEEAKPKRSRVPAKKEHLLFKGVSFVVTGMRGAHHENEAGSDDELNPDDDLISTSELCRMITKHGGQVLEDKHFFAKPYPPATRRSSSQANKPPPLILISDAPRRTLKYILAVACGVPCVRFSWVRECCDNMQTEPIEPYLLPSGRRLDGQMVTIQDPDKDLFQALRIEVAGSPHFKQGWTQVLRASGGCVVQRLFTSAESRIDAIFSDPEPADIVVRKAQALDLSLLTTEWLIQSILAQKAQKFTGRAEYYYTFPEEDN
eukprot:TRINITY_DN14316_c0_g1_i3.p1 TRINITY_DN14316_c0_g1~~TRINITY_DN14316_c0_g1_i3.p1  ORF type:complete len:638 (-),score=97.27 TRINITY_DN14316_c0_g1_i3:3-1916(-)